MSEKEDKTIYSWAYGAGRILFDCMKQETNSDVESLKRQFRNKILALRSEQSPERFKKKLVDEIVSVMPDCREKSLGLREEIRSEKKWSVDEFYRYSTAIIAGLYEAVFSSHHAQEEGEKQ